MLLLWRNCRMCLPNILSPVFIFTFIFHCHSFSPCWPAAPCWPLASLIISPPLWIFMFSSYKVRLFCFQSLALALSVGCLWHSHGKNPVRLYPKLQSQPIELPKIFIDYLFFQADQSDCTKSVSIFNRFASSEERWNQNVPCQICRAWVFPLVV